MNMQEQGSWTGTDVGFFINERNSYNLDGLMSDLGLYTKWLDEILANTFKNA